MDEFSKEIQAWIDELDINNSTEEIQKNTLQTVLEIYGYYIKE